MAFKISKNTKIKKIRDIYFGEYRNYGEVEVQIPEGITNIRSYAFEDCPNLETVYCPKSLKHIDEKAFYDCPNLKKVILQDDSQIVNLRITASLDAIKLGPSHILGDSVKKGIRLKSNRNHFRIKKLSH